MYISDEAPLTLDAYDALPNEAGFVIAPFQINPQTPLLFLRPQCLEHILLEALPQDEVQYAFSNDEAAEREDYAKSFAVVERALRDRQARKVVLSRRMQLHLEGDAPIDVRALMAKACRLYHINPDNALERTNQKFIRRFNYLEAKTKEQGRNLADMTLAEMDEIWNEATARGL